MNETELGSGLKRLVHIGLTVSNLETSVVFYRDVVGMKVTSEFSGHNDWFDELTNNPGAELKVAHLRLGAYELQLIEYLAGGLEGKADIKHNRIGSPHMCFLVDDIESRFEQVSQRGDVTITSGITNIVAGARSFYTEDPDGVPVEFVQSPPR